jgi:hypothetical protein
MKHIIIFFIIITVMLHISCHDDDELEQTFAKSVAWLWDQQSPDGAWRSRTHHVLSDGKVLTPYILFYLLQIPADVYTPSRDAIESAVSFIRQEMWRASVESCDSLVLVDYPNYSAAYALRVLVRTHTDTALQKMIASYLRDQQFIEHRGIGSRNMAYGGWGFGEPDIVLGRHGHVDLSHTRRVVEALMEAGAEVNTDAVACFLNSVQRHPGDPRHPARTREAIKLKYDGGFVSSMATTSTNKSTPAILEGSIIYYPSYATATCDGLMALKALGKESDQQYDDAEKWLTQYQSIDVVEGLMDDSAASWSQVMHYYHWAVRAEAMMSAGIKGTWKSDLKKALMKEQQADGSYFNPLGGVNKEDDPLMATIFCIQSMTSLLNSDDVEIVALSQF